ncbi:MAG: hypothetical protein U5Q03_13465 [Bacteroidota bacterium]|nr:hypothetical protein [Bacteroidota bacterium]
MFDLSILPKKAQDELFSYYQYLVEKYSRKKSTNIHKEKSRIKEINSFFDKYNLDFKGFSFNRDEIYES